MRPIVGEIPGLLAAPVACRAACNIGAKVQFVVVRNGSIEQTDAKLPVGYLPVQVYGRRRRIHGFGQGYDSHFR